MRVRGFVITLLTICSLLAVSSQARGQESQPAAQPKDPASVIRAVNEAMNAGDIDTAVSYYAEDIVWVALPPPPGQDAVIVGKEPKRADWELAPARNFSYEITELEVVGDNVAWKAAVHDDIFRELGVNPGTFDGVSIVQDGLVIAETWAMTEEFLDRFEAAIARQQNRAVVERLYEEVFNQKELSVADEIYDANVVDHDMGDNGSQEVKAKLAELLAGLPDLQVTADLWVIEGDLITTRVTFSGTHQGEWTGVAATGNPVTWTHIDIHRVQNGKITDIWHTVPGAEILQQIGYELVPPAQ